jgi:hypothetical protein
LYMRVQIDENSVTLTPFGSLIRIIITSDGRLDSIPASDTRVGLKIIDIKISGEALKAPLAGRSWMMSGRTPSKPSG